MSSQVGSGHVAIFPVMRGFKASVSREVKSSGKRAGTDFAASMKGAGRDAGRSLGTSLKQSFSDSSKSLGGEGFKQLKREVATASSQLSRARLKAQDEAGKVRTAEARLAEVVQRSGADSAAAVAATERLESARRRQAAADDQVTTASERLSRAQETLASITADTGNAAEGSKGKFSSFLDLVRDKATQAGATIKDRLGAALTGIADTLRGPATALVGAAATGMGIALTKGFSRLSAIDGARAKLTGLGHDGKTVATIMGDATKAVTGTAFGLGEAATVAAGAVAAGIKPGKQLENTLKGVANVAAATNRTMEDTGSIFNNVRANQAAYTQDIKQLANSGLPIWDALQKTLGATQDEVREMATKGEIDFDTFSKAAADAAGTVADEMGSTVPASISNMWAAVGRIGANILGGIDTETGEMYGLYAKFAPLVQSITAALGPLEEKAREWGATLEEKVGPILEKVTDFFTRLGEGSESLTGDFGGLLGVIAPIGGALLALGAGGIGGLLSKIPGLGGMLGGLGGIFKFLGGPIGMVLGLLGGLMAVDASTLTEGFASLGDMITSAVDTLVPTLVETISTLVPQLVETLAANVPALLAGAVSLFETLAQAVVTVLPLLLDAIVGIIPVLISSLLGMVPTLLRAGIQLIMALVDAVVKVAPMLIQAVIDLIPELAGALFEMLPELLTAAVELFMALVMAVTEILPPLIGEILALLPVLIMAILEMLPMLLEAAVELFLALVMALPVVIPQLLEAILGMLPLLLTTIIEMLPMILEAAVSLFMALVQALPVILPQLLTAIIGLIPSIVETVISLIPELLTAGIDLFLALVEALPEILPDLINAIIDMGPDLIAAVIDMIPDMIEAGKDLLMGLATGIGDAVSSVVSSAVDAAGEVVNSVKGFFGIASPSRLFRDEIGKMLPRGAAEGIDEEADALGSAAERMALSATARAQGAMQAVTTTIHPDPAATSGNNTGPGPDGEDGRIVQNNHFAHMDPEVAVELTERKLEQALGGV